MSEHENLEPTQGVRRDVGAYARPGCRGVTQTPEHTPHMDPDQKPRGKG